MTDSASIVQETEDGLTRVEVHFEINLKKLEQIASKISKAQSLKKMEEDE